MNHEHKDGCIFCDALSRADGVENLIAFRGQHSFIILNRYPYTSGHLMVVPNDHKPSMEFLASETCDEIMSLLNLSIKVIRAVYKPEGFNVGTNIGDVAGAGIASHTHFHVVPRWGGDTNFITTTGNARVIPEDLDHTYSRIVKALADLK